MTELRKYNCGNDGCNKNYDIAIGLERKVEELEKKLVEMKGNSVDKVELSKKIDVGIANLEKLLPSACGNNEYFQYLVGKKDGFKQIKDLVNYWL